MRRRALSGAMLVWAVLMLALAPAMALPTPLRAQVSQPMTAAMAVQVDCDLGAIPAPGKSSPPLSSPCGAADCPLACAPILPPGPAAGLIVRPYTVLRFSAPVFIASGVTPDLQDPPPRWAKAD